MTENYVFLNHPLSPETPTPPAIPPMRLTPFMSLANGDDANVTTIQVVTHTGTHVDAPCHVIQNGATLTDFSADEFIFHHPVVFDLPLGDDELVQPDQLEAFVEPGREADLVLFRFGYGPVRRTDGKRYSSHCPGFGVESAQYLRECFPQMRALGMDVPSLACIRYLETTMRAHNILLEGPGRRFLVIEDMHLDQDLGRLDWVAVAPWFIQSMDGGPAMILGRLGGD